MLLMPMQLMSIATGVFLMLCSLYILAKPGEFMGFSQRLLGGKLRYLAALLRLLIGVVFLATAAVSRYPLVFEVLGWLFVLGGLLLVVWPPVPLARIVGLIDRLPLWLVRMISPLIFLFGAFIFYSFT